MSRLPQGLATLLLAGALILAGLVAAPAWAGPVDWQEVPATEQGRQWWDAGSLRLDREGRLSVLSRFQPPAPPPADDGSTGRPPAGTLYVMQLDCEQHLYRDVSVNGLPRFGAPWQTAEGDDLGAAVIREACGAWGRLS